MYNKFIYFYNNYFKNHINIMIIYKQSYNILDWASSLHSKNM